MKKRRFIIALLISCILICCTAQAVTLRISVVDKQTDDALADASIYVDGDYVGRTASDGTYSYVHSGKRDLNLKVVRKGYRNWVDYVDYDEYRMEVEMVREDVTLTFELYDAATLKPVVGAVVRAEGADYSDSEVTGSSGSVKFPVKAGELYNVETRASGYYDLSKTVQMENSDRVVQYWLFSNDLLAIQVRDAETLAPLKGAEVYIDNARAGETDADGRLPLHLERAKRYSFRVTAPDYQPYQESRYLEVDNVLLTADLSKSAYQMSITAFDEATKPIEGAEIYLNGTLKGKTNPYGRFALSDIHAGTYEILVRASGYQDWSETRQISGQGEDIVAELGYDRASVTIRAKDRDQNPVAGADVVIDGQVIGVTNSQGYLNTALVTNKAYAVTAACEGYRNISVDADIPLGTTEFTIPLVLEQDSNIWVLVAGVGVVAAILIGAVLVIRHRRAGQNKGKSRGRDSL